ncbi:MAG TPA: hypothetical protein VMU79_00045 [Casimicrobiaceae bacterium]|jgi:hypothetical protein|nr:hypothetical protein [Casimicrobiaceae bacterium]
MALADKIWDGLTTVIKMNDKIERLAAAARTQQEKLEDLTARVVRLETALEIALSSRGPRRIERS